MAVARPRAGRDGGRVGRGARERRRVSGAATGADAVVVVTEWNEFRQLDLVKLAKNLKSRVLFDGRNIYEPARVKALGFMYYGVGRM